MLLNGLGFVSAPLYLFGQFFQGKATEQLLGEGVKPEHLNDDRLGNVLDEVYAAGLSELFLEISLAAANKFEVKRETAHLDSTSFHVDGAYASGSSEPGVIEITYGYSRNRRPDLKQFMMNLICVGDGDIPVLMEMASGNQSDKTRFAGKPTASPTLRWVFQCFMAVHLVVFHGVQQVVNLTDDRLHILQFFSPACRRYYLLCDPAS